MATKALNIQFGTNRDDYALYVGNNKIVRGRLSYIRLDMLDGHISPKDIEIYNKYFNSIQLNEQNIVNFGYIGYVDINAHFLSELAACLQTCKIGKKEKLDYSYYKTRLEICMSYWKDVYLYTTEHRKECRVEIGRLLHILEKEVSRL